jgi:hypothetical protein
MDLSVIIVNYRGWEHLRECLNSLEAFKGNIFSFEVIIVDNDSADGNLDEFIADYPEFIFVRNRINGGFAHGCNLGSTVSKGDFLLFLNPDTVASEETVIKLLERAKADPHNILSCNQINDKNEISKAYGLFPEFGTVTGFGRMIFRLVHKKKLAEKNRTTDHLIHPDWVSGSVMMMGRKVFLALGGFDEDFWMYYEDTDLCRRARDQGCIITYYTDVMIRHSHGGSSRINLRTISLTKSEVIISRHLYVFKHFRGGQKSIMLFFLILNNLMTGTVLALSGLILFAVPGMFKHLLIYGRVINYYYGVMKSKSWISPHSVNFKSKRI